MQKLFSSLTVKGVTLKNRMVVSAMVTGMCQKDGLATKEFIAYHEAKAKGGWGTIIPEDYVIAPNIGGSENLPGLWDDSQIESHKELTDCVHKYGTTIICQIYHAGRRMYEEDKVAPSPLPFQGTPQKIPRQLTIKEIEEITEQFAQCALRAKKAGFDGVEIHGANGYLLHQFISPFSNKRTDRYGGSLYGRASISLEIVKRTRELVGNDFLIFYRLSAEDHIKQGSLNIEEIKAFCMLLEEVGVDVLHISQGSDDASVVQPPSCIGKGAYINNAAEIKKVVNIPVIGVGRINDPFVAEEILVSDKADLVTMARTSVADPEFPNKVLEKQYDSINYCIGCGQGCTRGCTVNPMIGRETTCVITPAEEKKIIYVAGGGVAGCETAIIAAKRGHKVTLFEKQDSLGGQWKLACVPVGKTDFATFIPYLSGELDRAGVKVKLGTELTKEQVLNDKPDVVVVATGGEANIPPIPGIDQKEVVLAQDILSGKKVFGNSVVIIGGGSVGAETADYISAYGVKSVTVLEMADKIAADADAKPKKYLMNRLQEKGVALLTNAKVVAIERGVVKVLHNGVEKELPKVDTVILAAGVHSYHPLATELSDYSGEVYRVGDALTVKDGRANAAEGFLLGFKL